MKTINKTRIIIILISIFFGFVLAIQLKQNLPEFTPITVNSIKMTEYEIDALNNEIEELKVLLQDKEEKMQTYDDITSSDKSIIDILSDELQKTKTAAGFEELEGPGIIVMMQDNLDENAFGQEYDLDLIHDVDVLRILNDLRAAGAEAISINGQRVLATSEIKCGGPIIRINGRSIGTPIYISAIGDSELLNAAINAPNTYGFALKTIEELVIETSIEEEINIPAYKGNLRYNNAKPIREGD